MEYYAADPNRLNKMISDLTVSMDRRRRIANEELSAQKGSTALKVVDYEFYINQNAEKHHTELFELVDSGIPVLRRGDSFFMAIRFDRAYKEGSDLIRLVFNLGPNPNPTKGTSTVMLIKRKDGIKPKDNKQWSVTLDDVQDDTIVLEVFIPVTAPIGSWSCSAFTSEAAYRVPPLENKFRNYVYILFNPWCKDDGVYMEDEDEIAEYVMNDIGKIWKGTDKRPEGYRWVYGQFDEVVLPVVMILLEKSEVPHFDRWNPIKMARAIAAVANNEDDEGLLQGEWEDFSDGTSPFAWTGTVAIMEEYLNNQCNTVMYGQCWVFAGVVTTICRALGIPCRPVTNYHSAHDRNESLTIDVHYNQKGEKLEELNLDSCWNFHVWNEVFISRPDLPLGFGGWQAIDATPQETSENKYRCGPTSVAAVKKGCVTFLYDSQFVYSEVNADVCSLQLDDENNFCVVNMNKEYVGAQTVTKTIGPLEESDDNRDMEDITHQYKFQDKTERELALHNAIRSVPSAQLLYNEVPTTVNDVSFKLNYIETIAMGSSFRIAVALQNDADEARTISMSLSADSVRYTGVIIHSIKQSKVTFTLKPKQAENVSLLIKPDDYVTKLGDQSLIKMHAIANVAETKQTWLDDDDFSVVKPQIDIQIIGTPSADGIFEAVFSFQNILPIILTNCSFSVQMLGAKERPSITKFRDVNPNEEVTYKYTFSPSSAGESTIVATFASKQFTDVVGSKTVLVQ